MEIEAAYATIGIPGACGSMDVVHVPLGACKIEIGGSASKMAGPNVYTNDDPKQVNEDNDSNKSDKNSDDDKSEDNCTIDKCDDDNEHDESKAPCTFSPSTIFVILTMGVLSDDCDSLLNHAIDRGEVEEVNKATVPSRAKCRAIAIVDGKSATSSVKSQLTTATPSSATERLKQKANYNEAYKKLKN